jgi:hypothetical protein
MLKYLHQNGCEIIGNTFEEAIKRNNIEMVKYLHENQCPHNKYCISKVKVIEVANFIIKDIN